MKFDKSAIWGLTFLVLGFGAFWLVAIGMANEGWFAFISGFALGVWSHSNFVEKKKMEEEIVTLKK